jgi:hypothetical protein
MKLAPFQNVFNFTNPDEAIVWWTELFKNIVEKHCPMKTKRVKTNLPPPWLTKEIQNEMKKRKRLKQKKKFDEFKKQRNYVKHLIRKAKKNYFYNLVKNQTNTSVLWQAINKLTKNKNKSSDIPKNKTLDEINLHFLSIAKQLTEGAFQNADLYTCSDKLKSHCSKQLKNKTQIFYIPLLSITDVIKYISNMKNTKASGIDGITCNHLKMAKNEIAESLTYIYNLCIHKNYFPLNFKTAKIRPIPKCKDLSDLNNFRPISVLSILSKPLERHVHTHLTTYIEKYNLLSEAQSGFRSGHSCQTALTEMIDKWLLSINRQQVNGCVFLDFKKAFDLVNHSILLNKLSVYGLSDTTIQFFKSYLSERKQCVIIDNEKSSDGDIIFGVPQGSILGPLLFNLFINDLPLNIDSKKVSTNLFADDATINTSNKNVNLISKELQTSLDETSNWCLNNHMILNPTKTKSMLITTRQKHQCKFPKINVSFNNKSIEQITSHKLLGAQIDNQLSWRFHLKNVCSKISKNIFLLNKLKHYLNLESKLLFFHAHIKSHIDYTSNIWDGCDAIHLKKLTSLYRRAVKYLIDDTNRTTDEKFKKLNILPLEQHLQYKKLIFVHKVFHGQTPKKLTTLLKKAKHSNTLILPKTRLELYKTSFSFSGSKLWNTLPRRIKNISNIGEFKKKLHHHLE